MAIVTSSRSLATWLSGVQGVETGQKGTVTCVEEAWNLPLGIWVLRYIPALRVSSQSHNSNCSLSLASCEQHLSVPEEPEVQSLTNVSFLFSPASWLSGSELVLVEHSVIAVLKIPTRGLAFLLCTELGRLYSVSRHPSPSSVLPETCLYLPGICLSNIPSFFGEGLTSFVCCF